MCVSFKCRGCGVGSWLGAVINVFGILYNGMRVAFPPRGTISSKVEGPCCVNCFSASPGSSWRLVPRARLVSAHLCGARYQAKWRGHFGLIVFMLPGSSWEVVISAFRNK